MDEKAAELIDAIDWSKTPLGPRRSWPTQLTTIVDVMLGSRHPMFLWWGPELVQIYNDAYVPSFGIGKHPAAMGQRGVECWGEIWPIIWPQIDDVMARGKASWNEDHLVPIFRNGRIEEVYWTYGYSPVTGPDGKVGGCFVVCTETTGRVIVQRRLELLRRLAAALANTDSVERTVESGRAVFKGARLDVPYAVRFRDGVLVHAANVDPSAFPTEPTTDGLMTTQPVTPLDSPWPEAPTQAFVIRSRSPMIGTMIFGVSARLPFDRDYEQFIRDWVEHVDLAVERAEASRERAAVLAELESVNEAKDVFLANVSHELRTPLNSILGWVRMLRSGEVKSRDVDHALAVIERNSLAQAHLIEDLLDVSRIVSGKLRLELRTVDVAALVKMAMDSIANVATTKGLRLEHAIDEDVGSIVADPDRLQQVVWNLLSNATKFTPTGGRIEVSVRRTAEHVEIAVTDTGRGISADLLPHVFDRFRQAEGAPARGGLGLGLAIARHIAEAHHGSVVATSEGAGRGASFVVRVPRGNKLGARVATATEDEYVPAPGALRDLSVLVVDDDPDNAEVLRTMLEQLGCVVVSARNGEEALATMERSMPRVVVSDIAMPTMDGYELVRAIRARPADRGGRTLALALTAHGGGSERQRALEAGFQMYLTKPIDRDALVSAMTTLAQLSASQTP